MNLGLHLWTDFDDFKIFKMGDSNTGPSGFEEKALSPGGDMTSQLYSILMQNATTTEIPVPQDNASTCDVIDSNYDIATSVICAFCFVIGILYTFCGKSKLPFHRFILKFTL